MLFIGECQSILKEISRAEAYDKLLVELFGLRKSAGSPAPSPLYKSIFDLKIKRFVTTNYDLELERQLLAAYLFSGFGILSLLI